MTFDEEIRYLMRQELDDVTTLVASSADAKLQLHEKRLAAAQARLEASVFNSAFPRYANLLTGSARKEYLAKLRLYDKAISRLMSVESEKREARRQVIEALTDLRTRSAWYLERRIEIEKKHWADMLENDPDLYPYDPDHFELHMQDIENGIFDV
ncbi:hypothetical protein M5X11_17535 [Paenibacillus alginolyticus]|uniref:hypothetical protein n=1 Tax=Paenibacillus alginolyticus TaxID=59839 RepID=UPI00049258F9|nr:hypothetical protein [Paenibacillus alginolyticus]MCY9666708.1 hypothetical protein [Paenibacillus alginolyticus]